MPALEELAAQVGPEPSPAGEGEGSAPGAPPPPPPQEDAMPPEHLAEMVLQFADQFLKAKGLSPLNPVQAFLIRSGIVGTARKYGVSFDVERYPEVALIAGAVWVAADKMSELKKRPPASPGPGSTAPPMDPTFGPPDHAAAP